MANFNTHLLVAATITGVAATLVLSTQAINQIDVIVLTGLGIIGGLLPDIDSDNSRPIKIFIELIAILIAFLIMFALFNHIGLIALWVIWLLTYLFVKVFVFDWFKKATIHRGIIHSVLAGLFFCGLTIVIADSLLHVSNLMAWLSGTFVFLGFFIHLCLDEWYSVDLKNRRIKQSFGTAFKLYHYSDIKSSVILAIATVFLFAITPNSLDFTSVLFNSQTYIVIFNKLI